MVVRGYAILLFVWALVSCNTSANHSVMVDVDSDEWFEPVELTLEVYDSEVSVDMDIALRYHTVIAGEKMELHIATTAPDGVRWSENITIQLPDTEGLILNYDAPYRHSVQWPTEGEYRFRITPNRIYAGVAAVGINISK